MFNCKKCSLITTCVSLRQFVPLCKTDAEGIKPPKKHYVFVPYVLSMRIGLRLCLIINIFTTTGKSDHILHVRLFTCTVTSYILHVIVIIINYYVTANTRACTRAQAHTRVCVCEFQYDILYSI